MLKIVCENDFIEYVVPHLERCDKFPTELFFSDIGGFYRSLYMECIRQAGLWRFEQSLTARYGIENLDLKAIAVLTHSGLDCFAKLLCWRGEGCSSVKVSAHRGCSRCRREFQKNVYDVDALLDAYHGKKFTLGMLPHPKCLREWCTCVLLRCSNAPHGVDPEFSRWLDELLE